MADGGEENGADEHANQQEQAHAKKHPPGIKSPTTLQSMEKWKTWKQMWHNYCIVASIKDQNPEYQTALFLHSIGEKALEIYNSFDFQNEHESNDLATIIKKFDAYAIGEKNETYERYIFNCRHQEPGESFEKFLGSTRTLAQTCNFCKCMYESLIRDKILIGIVEQETRRKLLDERELTLNQCIDICRAAEKTDQQMKVLNAQSQESSANVNRVMKHKQNARPTSSTKRNKPRSNYSGKSETSDARPKGNKMINCRYCGKSHVQDKYQCPAYDKKCRRCGNKGHFAEVCKSRSKDIKRVEEYEETYTDSSDTDSTEYVINYIEEYSVNKVTRPTDKDIYAEMQIVNTDTKVAFQLDSGAKINTIPENMIENKNLIEYKKKYTENVEQCYIHYTRDM
jgi:hypothetical protein